MDRLEQRALLCWFPSVHASLDHPNELTLASGAAGTFAWESGTNNPQVRFESTGAAVNGKLYVFGGFFNGSAHTTVRSDVYDPATNTWTPIADLPEHVTHVSQAVDGHLIYLAGGFEGNWPGGSIDYVRVYNTVTNTWTNGPSLPADRGGAALVRLGRELHFYGGASTPAGSNVLTDFGTHWVLQLGPTASVADDATSWTTAATMPNPRNHMGGAAVGGKVYAVGGQHGADEANGNQSSVHAYDPATDMWTAVASMPRPLGHITSSTFAHNGRVVVAAGVTQGGIEEARVIEYDPASDTWVHLPTLPGPREGPVADSIGTRIILATGEAQGVPFADTWVGQLEGNWETGGASSGAAAQMPVALSEVAAGIVGNKLFVVGSSSAATLAYDLSLNQWSAPGALAVRPFTGDHHAAEVFGGRLYLFGGLGAGSSGRVQIYDPVANQWTLGADMPFAAGSSASAVISGQVYVAGGIVGGGVTDQLARYDPATNTWTPLAGMPQAVNHAAAATDGQRLFVFGGRTTTGLTNVDTVQVYDPVSNTWQSSHTPGSTLTPLPEPRSGMGKAAYVNGEFYVFGGEAFNHPPLGTFDRVDIYSALTNTWRPGTAMPTARHGIFPIAHAERIYVAGGGVQVGVSSSTILEVYNPVLVPYVQASEFLFEQAPLRIRVRFSEDVSASLQPADLSVQRLPGDPPFTPTGVNYDAATNAATFTLTTPLPDGNCRATLLAGGVTDAAGNALAANVPIDFFVLAGDANRDRQVNLADFNILAANFGQGPRTFSQGDFNYDTVVNLDDFNVLASRFGAAVAPATAAVGVRATDEPQDDVLRDLLG
jgi:N-acetylneuraminic acid mutarotase